MPQRLPLPAADPARPPASQAARARVALGNFSADAEVVVTPVGMVALGGAIAMVLLAVAPIILSAAVARRAKGPPRG